MTTTYTTFALKLGQADRLTREASTPLHAAFKKGDKEQQSQAKADWISGYLQGNLSIMEQGALKIMAKGRDDRTAKEQQSYDRARQQFKYHVERPGDADQTKAPTKKAKLAILMAQAVKLGFDKATMVAALNKAITAAADAE